VRLVHVATIPSASGPFIFSMMTSPDAVLDGTLP
jgi:hypothetical protein